MHRSHGMRDTAQLGCRRGQNGVFIFVRVNNLDVRLLEFTNQLKENLAAPPPTFREHFHGDTEASDLIFQPSSIH